jgi:hypothetical protein
MGRNHISSGSHSVSRGHVFHLLYKKSKLKRIIRLPFPAQQAWE